MHFGRIRFVFIFIGRMEPGHGDFAGDWTRGPFSRQACTSTLADGDSSNAGEDLRTMAEMIGPLCRIHAVQRLAQECDQALCRFDYTMTSIPQTDFCIFAQRECRLLRDGNQRAKAKRTVVRGSYGG